MLIYLWFCRYATYNTYETYATHSPLQVHFMLGDDDHDLHTRAWYQKQYAAGWMPLDFRAPLKLGGSRRPAPPPLTRREEAYKSARLARAPGAFAGPGGGGHSQDRAVPAEYGCMASRDWYTNATTALLAAHGG